MACRLLLMAVLLLAFADQAFANWWIVRASDEKCLVVDLERIRFNPARIQLRRSSWHIRWA